MNADTATPEQSVKLALELLVESLNSLLVGVREADARLADVSAVVLREFEAVFHREYADRARERVVRARLTADLPGRKVGALERAGAVPVASRSADSGTRPSRNSKFATPAVNPSAPRTRLRTLLRNRRPDDVVVTGDDRYAEFGWILKDLLDLNDDPDFGHRRQSNPRT